MHFFTFAYPRSCWITNNIVFYVAVVAYFCIVFLINFTMFIVVLVQLCRIKRQNPQNVQNRSYWQEIRSVAGLTVLLGLTWGFAFFAWGPVNLPFMYLFAIFNSLQGKSQYAHTPYQHHKINIGHTRFLNKCALTLCTKYSNL